MNTHLCHARDDHVSRSPGVRSRRAKIVKNIAQTESPLFIPQLTDRPRIYISDCDSRSNERVNFTAALLTAIISKIYSAANSRSHCS